MHGIFQGHKRVAQNIDGVKDKGVLNDKMPETSLIRWTSIIKLKVGKEVRKNSVSRKNGCFGRIVGDSACRHIKCKAEREEVGKGEQMLKL